MSASGYAQPEGSLLFHWERPRRRRLAIAGFLLASAALHALCFYLFQVVYPPAISLLPPPAQVSVIAPTTAEARAFLDWLKAEDPALASQTQRPEDARAFQLPKLAHIPSYVAVPPALKEPPSFPAVRGAVSATPPGPVPMAPANEPAAPLLAPTTLFVTGELGQLPIVHPAFNFRASVRQAPQAARFRLAVDSLGEVRYAFLEQSSGDTALDAQARHYLSLARFQNIASLGNNEGLRWSTGSFEFGNDLELPPTPAGRAP
ncbi:MAG: hypothetical protein H0T83_01630 [Chthoniobacterales bacterium]|nr:hypothetical protein [Chthoniobacterales bacterium]